METWRRSKRFLGKVIVHLEDLLGFSRTQREDPKGKGVIKLEGGLTAASSVQHRGQRAGNSGCSPSLYPLCHSHTGRAMPTII